jgi:hypothetical protein
MVLNQEETNEPRKAPKTFAEQPTSQGNLYPQEVIRTKPQQSSGKNGYFSIMLILVLILNLGASYFMVTKFAPSITTVDVIAGQVNLNTEAINAESVGLNARLDNVINSMGLYAKKTDLSGYALNSTLSTYALASTVTGFMNQAQVEALIETARLSLQSDVLAAETAITELEALVAAIDLTPITQGYDVSVIPYVSGGNLSLGCSAQVERTVMFEITFIRTDGIGTPTLTAPLPVVTVSGTDSFTFTTPVTTVAAGDSVKYLTFTAVGGWIISVQVVNVAITSGGTVW